MVRPTISLLTKSEMEEINEGALEILEKVGIMCKNANALSILHKAGAEVDNSKQIAKISKDLVKYALKKAPPSIKLFYRDGKRSIELKENNVCFNPGSTAINVLDFETNKVRKGLTRDLTNFVRVADALDNIHAQSTAIICSNVPEEISDVYRLFLVLKNSTKPIITGAFSIEGIDYMKNILSTIVGEENLAKKPLAIFDACPSPPLMWSEITSQNVIDCAKLGLPVEIIPMPLSGATGPVTIAGSVVQHTAEGLSGVVLAQLTNPGAPVIYGGSPSPFEMRFLTTPMGAIETMLIDCAYVQMGKFYGLPTHAYLGLSDSKIIDTQAGFESGIGLILGALAGINVISAPGMMDFESCQSIEKLVIDNDICGMALRLIKGIQVDNETLAVDLIKNVGPGKQFLTTEHTRKWFRAEHFIPSTVVDRLSRERWEKEGSKNAFERAHSLVKKILSEHTPEQLPADVEKELNAKMLEIAKKHGMAKLPKE